MRCFLRGTLVALACTSGAPATTAWDEAVLGDFSYAGASPTGSLGWVHDSVNDIGTEIPGLMGIGFGAAGFVTPLPAGDYSFWIQNTSTGSSPYVLEFNVSAVPEASALSLFSVGLAGRHLRGGQRRRSL